MSHIQPKDLVTVQYLGEERTRFTPFINGEKVDIMPNEKVEMDARQAAVVLVDHLRWKKISERKNGLATGGVVEKKEKDDEEEKPKAKKSK